MGKRIKTQLDYVKFEKFVQELNKLQTDNLALQHYLKMDNFEGGELRKAINK